MAAAPREPPDRACKTRRRRERRTAFRSAARRGVRQGLVGRCLPAGGRVCRRPAGAPARHRPPTSTSCLGALRARRAAAGVDACAGLLRSRQTAELLLTSGGSQPPPPSTDSVSCAIRHATGACSGRLRRFYLQSSGNNRARLRGGEQSAAPR